MRSPQAGHGSLIRIRQIFALTMKKCSQYA